MDKKKLYYLSATWFKSGTSKKMPGTLGTLAAIPLYIFLNLILSTLKDVRIINSLYFAFLVFFFFYSLKVSRYAEEIIYKEKDPQSVVIDEVLGFMTTMFLVNPKNFSEAVVAITIGFILFRILDITKPGIINKIQNYKHGLGIILDDFIAGVLANILLIMILTFIQNI